jgi:hypothetical protein
MDEAERLCSRLLVLDHGRKIAEGRPRELIAQHLEPDVVEVYGNGALALARDEAHAGLRALAARVEVSGETVFFYTAQALPLLAALGAHPQLRTLHRPANLEDLFLKLTGRQIREEGSYEQHGGVRSLVSLGAAASIGALVAGVSAQFAGVEKARHSQPGGQHCRAADVVGGVWLRHGGAGGAGHHQHTARRGGRALHLVFSQRQHLHERHERGEL